MLALQNRNKEIFINTYSFKKPFNETDIPLNPKQNVEENLKEKILSNMKEEKEDSFFMDWNRNNTNLIENNKEEIFSNTSSLLKGEINMEIYPDDDEISINKDENLLHKKIDLNKSVNLSQIKYDNEYKNYEVEKLLDSFKYEATSKKADNMNTKSQKSFNLYEKNTGINRLLIKENKSKKNIVSVKSNEMNNKSYNGTSINRLSSLNVRLKTNWDSKILSVNSNISFQFDSSYENCNILSGEN